MISAIQTSVQGMERASKLVNTAATDIAKGAGPPSIQTPAPTGGSSGNISLDMANLIVGHRTYDANGKVIEVAARMLDKTV